MIFCSPKNVGNMFGLTMSKAVWMSRSAMYIVSRSSLSCQFFRPSSCHSWCFCSTWFIITWNCCHPIPSTPPRATACSLHMILLLPHVTRHMSCTVSTSLTLRQFCCNLWYHLFGSASGFLRNPSFSPMKPWGRLVISGTFHAGAPWSSLRQLSLLTHWLFHLPSCGSEHQVNRNVSNSLIIREKSSSPYVLNLRILSFCFSASPTCDRTPLLACEQCNVLRVRPNDDQVTRWRCTNYHPKVARTTVETNNELQGRKNLKITAVETNIANSKTKRSFLGRPLCSMARRALRKHAPQFSRSSHFRKSWLMSDPPDGQLTREADLLSKAWMFPSLTKRFFFQRFFSKPAFPIPATCWLVSCAPILFENSFNCSCISFHSSSLVD